MAITEVSEFVQNNLEEIHSSAVHKSFLGREFLTWLWFKSESEDSEFSFKDKEIGALKGHISIDDKIVLTAKAGLSHDHIIKGGNPAQCQEAAVALRQGKSVRELRLRLELEGFGGYSFTLDGDDLAPKSVQLPEPREDTEDSPLEQRIRAIAALSSVLDFLMTEFMEERTGKVWDSERLQAIRDWIKTRAKARDGIIH